MPGRTTAERPHSIELERALLGGLILNPGRIPQIGALVGVSDLYRPDHAALYGLLLEMHAAGDPIEPVTVQERACRGQRGAHSHPADRYGGIVYVVETPDHAPSTANLDYYARRIRTLADWRRVADAADELQAAVAEAGRDPEAGVDEPLLMAAAALAEVAALASPEARARALAGLARVAGREMSLGVFRAAFGKGAP